MKVLVLSKEVWRDDQNGGNVLSNIFSGLDAEFAQVYCSDGLPNNTLCRRYYQMTDAMMATRILKGAKPGRVLLFSDLPSFERSQQPYSGLKHMNLESVRLVRELGWRVAKWDEVGLREFVTGFAPDVIFAPCYGSHYMLRLTRTVWNWLQIPIISYISDDFYTNKQFRCSPVFWINHFLLRKHVREIFPLYQLVYTMTEEQMDQCERDFGANMRVLRKSGAFETERTKCEVGVPVRFVYAGGLYLNRWKTLLMLRDCLAQLNREGVVAVLDIYSGDDVKSTVKKKLDDGVNSAMHPLVSTEELRRIYGMSDIALHVESFDRKYAAATRMSFSTKIVDCLDSGCAVMAICSRDQAGFAYLKRNDAAICVAERGDLFETVKGIVENPDTLLVYQRKAFELGRRNHCRENTEALIASDFTDIHTGSRMDPKAIGNQGK